MTKVCNVDKEDQILDYLKVIPRRITYRNLEVQEIIDPVVSRLISATEEMIPPHSSTFSYTLMAPPAAPQVSCRVIQTSKINPLSRCMIQSQCGVHLMNPKLKVIFIFFHFIS